MPKVNNQFLTFCNIKLHSIQFYKVHPNSKKMHIKFRMNFQKFAILMAQFGMQDVHVNSLM